jgi:hypothetical protein
VSKKVHYHVFFVRIYPQIPVSLGNQVYFDDM